VDQPLLAFYNITMFSKMCHSSKLLMWTSHNDIIKSHIFICWFCLDLWKIVNFWCQLHNHSTSTLGSSSVERKMEQWYPTIKTIGQIPRNHFIEVHGYLLFIKQIDFDSWIIHITSTSIVTKDSPSMWKRSVSIIMILGHLGHLRWIVIWSPGSVIAG
jgi:hypothetical protein